MEGPRVRDRFSRTLVGISIAVAIIDAPVLLLSVGFGPEGFGGDANPSPRHVTSYHRGQVAGVVALAISVAGLAANFAIEDPSRRRAVLTGAVVAQLAAFVWFWVAAGG